MGKSEKERTVEILLKEIKKLTSDCIDRSMDIISKRHPNERYKFDSISFDERKVTVYFIEDSPADFKEFRHVYLEVQDIATSLQDWDSKIDSHSPTEPELNTLQEGDYVTELTQEQWFDLVAIMDSPVYPIWKYSMRSGMLFNGKILIHYDPKEIKNKLTPEEFLRRAENTFKTK